MRSPKVITKSCKGCRLHNICLNLKRDTRTVSQGPPLAEETLLADCHDD